MKLTSNKAKERKEEIKEEIRNKYNKPIVKTITHKEYLIEDGADTEAIFKKYVKAKNELKKLQKDPNVIDAYMEFYAVEPYYEDAFLEGFFIQIIKNVSVKQEVTETEVESTSMRLLQKEISELIKPDDRNSAMNVPILLIELFVDGKIDIDTVKTYTYGKGV